MVNGHLSVGERDHGTEPAPAATGMAGASGALQLLMLTVSESRRVQGWIANKCPDQMRLPFALWTAQAVRELIHQKFGKTLGLSTMQLHLKRWGFSAQKPLSGATQRDPRKIAV